MGEVQSPASDGNPPKSEPDKSASIVVGHANITPAAARGPQVVPQQTQPNAQQQLPLQQQYGARQNAFLSQFDMAQASVSRPPAAPYNMVSIANALPQVTGYGRSMPYSPQQPTRYNPSVPVLPPVATQQMMTQMPSVGQFSGHNTMPLAPQQYYYPPHSQQPSLQTPRPGVHYYTSPMVMAPSHLSHPGMVQPAYYYSPSPHYTTTTHQMPTGLMSTAYPAPVQAGPDPRYVVPPAPHETGPVTSPVRSESGMENKKDEPFKILRMGPGTHTVVRGPPRKPKQSGHAIWIGNLPPQTDLMKLVHHVCKEANGLESLFLISKSNCAFANFKDETKCLEAQQKLHDSKFQSVRLVSRLRKSTVEGSSGTAAPTAPAATATVTTIAQSPSTEPQPLTGKSEANSATNGQTHESIHAPTDDQACSKDKYFILKSLTVEDLDLSVKTQIWATQPHNEEALNKAFESADNVYLIFSANKSGEYFGYARMTSSINQDPAAAIQFAPTTHAVNDIDLPKAIPTEPTEFAPRGRIIDDSARGTIFWEAEKGEGEMGEDDTSETSSTKSGDQDGEVDGQTRAWGKPFQLEWLSTSKIPFYRTRGLRNPWNSNREVKIARDGTELEPTVGLRLVGLFSKVHSPAATHPGIRPGMVGPGFPAMRPYHV